MKKLFITGNLTKDIELKAHNDISVATLNIAVNDANNETVYFAVEVWRGLAEVCAKSLKKGSPVSVLADVRTNNYEKDGVKYYGYKFIAEEVQFIAGAKK